MSQIPIKFPPERIKRKGSKSRGTNSQAGANSPVDTSSTDKLPPGQRKRSKARGSKSRAGDLSPLDTSGTAKSPPDQRRRSKTHTRTNSRAGDYSPVDSTVPDIPDIRTGYDSAPPSSKASPGSLLSNFNNHFELPTKASEAKKNERQTPYSGSTTGSATSGADSPVDGQATRFPPTSAPTASLVDAQTIRSSPTSAPVTQKDTLSDYLAEEPGGLGITAPRTSGKITAEEVMRLVHEDMYKLPDDEDFDSYLALFGAQNEAQSANGSSDTLPGTKTPTGDEEVTLNGENELSANNEGEDESDSDSEDGYHVNTLDDARQVIDEYKDGLLRLNNTYDRIRLQFDEDDDDKWRSSPDALNFVGDAFRGAEEELIEQQKAIEELKKAINKLESAITEVDEGLQRKNLDHDLTLQRLEELQGERDELTKKISQVRTEIDTLRKEGPQETPEECQAGADRILGFVTKLGDELETMQQALAENTSNVLNLTQLLNPDTEEPKQLADLRLWLASLLDSYVNKHEDMKRQYSELSLQLTKLQTAKQEQELRHKNEVEQQELKRQKEVELLKEAARRPGIARKPSAESVISLISLDSQTARKDTWQLLYEEKNASFERLKKDHEKLRTRYVQYNAPQLKRQNEDLERRVVELTDQLKLAVAERETWKSCATSWQDENTDLQQRFEAIQGERENQIENLENEKSVYIKEYYDSLPKNDPEWYQVEPLQKLVKENTDELHELSMKNLRLRGERDRAIDEFKDLRAAMEEGKKMKYQPHYTYAEPEAVQIPRYESEGETQERCEMLDEIWKRLEEDPVLAKAAKREELIEQARAHMMGQNYPPFKDYYLSLVKKSPEERWELQGFYEKAPEDTRRDIERLGLVEVQVQVQRESTGTGGIDFGDEEVF